MPGPRRACGATQNPLQGLTAGLARGAPARQNAGCRDSMVKKQKKAGATSEEVEKLSGKPEWRPRHKGPRGAMDQKWRAWPRLISSRSRTEGASSQPLPGLSQRPDLLCRLEIHEWFGPSNSSPCPKQALGGPAPLPRILVGVSGSLAYSFSMPARPPLLPSDRRARPSVAASQDASRARVFRAGPAPGVSQRLRVCPPALPTCCQRTHNVLTYLTLMAIM